MIEIDTTLIPKPLNDLRKDKLHRNGDTQDIIEVVLATDKEDDPRFCAFAAQFSGRNGLRKLWEFVRYKIQYQEDGYGTQDIKTPAALWKMGVGDCKSKTLFVNQILRCLGIPYTTRFAGYGIFAKNVTHVYSIAHTKQGDVIIDTVYDMYGVEKTPTLKKDYQGYMTRINKISGLSGIEECNAYGAAIKEVAAIRERWGAIPQQERIEFDKISEGKALLQILMRRYQILSVYDERNTKTHLAAIDLIKKVLCEKNSVGVIPDALQGLAAEISRCLTFTAPAIDTARYDSPVKFPCAISGWAGNTYTNATNESYTYSTPFQPFNPNTSLQYSQLNANGLFVFGSRSRYAKPMADIAPKMGTLAVAMMGENEQFKGANIPLNNDTLRKLLGVDKRQTSQILLPGQYLLGATDGLNGITQAIKNNQSLRFASAESRSEYIRRLKEASGVLSDYANDMLADAGGIGNGFMYAFAENVRIGNKNLRIGDYPAAVIAKYATHSQYVSGFSKFSGLSETVIKNMAKNNVMYHCGGKAPNAILGGIMQKINPNIGLAPATLTAIISLITIVVQAIQEFAKMKQSEAKNVGETIDTLPDGFTNPIGESVQFQEEDFTSGSGSGSGGSNDNKGSNNGLLIAGGAAAALWYFNSKKSKK